VTITDADKHHNGHNTFCGGRVVGRSDPHPATARQTRRAKAWTAVLFACAVFVSRCRAVPRLRCSLFARSCCLLAFSPAPPCRSHFGPRSGPSVHKSRRRSCRILQFFTSRAVFHFLRYTSGTAGIVVCLHFLFESDGFSIDLRFVLECVHCVDGKSHEHSEDTALALGRGLSNGCAIRGGGLNATNHVVSLQRC
jgi:hypothetical protein